MSLEEARSHVSQLAKMFGVEIRDFGTWFAGRFRDGSPDAEWIWAGLGEDRRMHIDYIYEGDDFEALRRLNPALTEPEIMRLLGRG